MDTSVKNAIEKVRIKIKADDKQVISVADPYVMMSISENKKIGYADITYKSKSDKVTEESKNKVLQSITKY